MSGADEINLMSGYYSSLVPSQLLAADIHHEGDDLTLCEWNPHRVMSPIFLLMF